MAQIIQAVRGMNDILPSETALWQWAQTQIVQTLGQYSYQEIRLPIVESTALFARGIGDGTDIVEKEMYTFVDRNGDSLSLRPEGTAGCVRALIEHGLLHHQVQRLWYCGPMFRHERPQKGRYRQFYQLGIEALGVADPLMDVEMIALTAQCLQRLGVAGHLSLQLNTLGTPAVRQAHRAALIEYLTAHQEQLDEDSQRRLHKNPLRILDTKNPALQALVAGAPKLIDYLDEASAQHYARVKAGLEALGIPYQENPRLVRGLDYYTHTVFEWVTTALGAQGTVCAGGRYDGLVEEFGGPATPAIGCAIGLERLLLLLTELKVTVETAPDVYWLSMGEAAQLQSMVLATSLRQALPGLKIMMHCGADSFKSQFKKADKSGARLAVIMGDSECAEGNVTVKFLREERPQETMAQSELVGFLQAVIPRLDRGTHS